MMLSTTAFAAPAHLLRRSRPFPPPSLCPARASPFRPLATFRPLDGGDNTVKNPSSKHASPLDPPSFTIESERQLFQRYQTVYERNVRYPDGRLISFDVLGNANSDFQSVFVFPYHSASRTVTLLREYSPGSHARQMAFVAGMFEPSKHANLEAAARAEMSEEAHLKGGELVRLCSSETGISADKYSTCAPP